MVVNDTGDHAGEMLPAKNKVEVQKCKLDRRLSDAHAINCKCATAKGHAYKNNGLIIASGHL